MQHWKKKQQQQQKCFLIALPLLLASSLSLFVALMTTHKYACDLKSVSFWFFFCVDITRDPVYRLLTGHVILPSISHRMQHISKHET